MGKLRCTFQQEPTSNEANFLRPHQGGAETRTLCRWRASLCERTKALHKPVIYILGQLVLGCQWCTYFSAHFVQAVCCTGREIIIQGSDHFVCLPAPIERRSPAFFVEPRNAHGPLRGRAHIISGLKLRAHERAPLFCLPSLYGVNYFNTHKGRGGRMGRRVLTEEEEGWLRQNVTAPLHEQAAKLGVCTDTVKRLHVNLGLRQYPGAKYQPKKSATWKRPCIKCGCTKRRPRNHYLCKNCRREAGYG